MTSFVSDFSLFSKETKPKGVSDFSKISLGPVRYSFNYELGTYLNPKPIVLHPPRERVATVFCISLIWTIELLYIFSGAPFTKAYILPSDLSLTSTDMDWNRDSNWLILSTSRWCCLFLFSASNLISAFWEWCISNSEKRNILRSTSSPKNSPSMCLVVWQVAKSFQMNWLS